MTPVTWEKAGVTTDKRRNAKTNHNKRSDFTARPPRALSEHLCLKRFNSCGLIEMFVTFRRQSNDPPGKQLLEIVELNRLNSASRSTSMSSPKCASGKSGA